MDNLGVQWPGVGKVAWLNEECWGRRFKNLARLDAAWRNLWQTSRHTGLELENVLGHLEDLPDFPEIHQWTAAVDGVKAVTTKIEYFGWLPTARVL